MEDYLSKAGLQLDGLNPTTFAEIERLHAIYTELERVTGWQDIVGRLKVIRSSLVNDLVVGTLDKFGNTRDDSKRAALFVIDKVLALTPGIHRQYDDLLKRKAQMEQRAQGSSEEGLYGGDAFQDQVPPEVSQPRWPQR